MYTWAKWLAISHDVLGPPLRYGLRNVKSWPLRKKCLVRKSHLQVILVKSELKVTLSLLLLRDRSINNKDDEDDD
jgi:hypothetical protein